MDSLRGRRGCHLPQNNQRLSVVHFGRASVHRRHVRFNQTFLLQRHNGDDSWTLAMPGRFIVDSSAVVRAVSVDPDYTKRPEPETVLEELEAL